MKISVAKLELFLDEVKRGNYSVSLDGEVVNNLTWRTVGKGNGKRPPTVAMTRNDKLLVVGKHLLVWSYFNGIPDPNSEIYFKDGDCNNCALDNLAIATQGTRAIEAWKTLGKTIVGEKNINAKFTNEKVCQIREEFANTKISAREIARREGVSHPTIVDMLSGKTYPDAGGPTNIKKPRTGNKPGPDKTKLFLCWHILHKTNIPAAHASKVIKINTSTVYRWSKRYDPSEYDKHREIFVGAYKDNPKLLRKLGFPIIKDTTNDSGDSRGTHPSPT